MDIMALGAIGEMVGGVAVLATLVYLALQVRQGAAATTVNATHAWLEDYNHMVREIVKDPAVALILRKGLTDFDTLGGNDQMRFHAWMAAHIIKSCGSDPSYR